MGTNMELAGGFSDIAETIHFKLCVGSLLFFRLFCMQAGIFNKFLVFPFVFWVKEKRNRAQKLFD